MTAFNNRATMKEKVEQLRNDQRNASTLHEFAKSEAGEIGGRWAKPQTVNASRPAVEYPRIKSGPWADGDPTGVEPPYPEDISSPPIVGEYAEVQASLDANFGLERSLRDGAPPSPGGLIPAALEQAPDSAVARAPSADHARQPLPLSGRHSRKGRVSPTNSIRRRLV